MPPIPPPKEDGWGEPLQLCFIDGYRLAGGEGLPKGREVLGSREALRLPSWWQVGKGEPRAVFGEEACRWGFLGSLSWGTRSFLSPLQSVQWCFRSKWISSGEHKGGLVLIKVCTGDSRYLDCPSSNA